MAAWARYANFLIRIALVLPLALAAWNIFPIYSANTQLEQYMEKAAMAAVVHGYSEGQIMAGVSRKVRELKLPVKEHQIEVEVDQDQVLIAAKYQVSVDLVATNVRLPFHPRALGRKPKLTKEGLNEMKELMR